MDAGAVQKSTPLERTRARLLRSIEDRDAAPDDVAREFHNRRIDKLLEEYMRLMVK